jgi:undecaprenyl-phosphate 4-deoxy-4-formamido-L-arabinose transferase
MTDISVVIPVYNGARTITELHRRLVAVLEQCADAFEVVFVDDCGTDDSWDVIEAIAARDPRVRGIRLSRNFGQHNALLCGIRNARHEMVVTMDDDLQNPPEEIPRLLAKLGKAWMCL